MACCMFAKHGSSPGLSMLVLGDEEKVSGKTWYLRQKKGWWHKIDDNEYHYVLSLEEIPCDNENGMPTYRMFR